MYIITCNAWYVIGQSLLTKIDQISIIFMPPAWKIRRRTVVFGLSLGGVSKCMNWRFWLCCCRWHLCFTNKCLVLKTQRHQKEMLKIHVQIKQLNCLIKLPNFEVYHLYCLIIEDNLILLGSITSWVKLKTMTLPVHSS